MDVHRHLPRTSFTGPSPDLYSEPTKKSLGPFPQTTKGHEGLLRTPARHLTAAIRDTTARTRLVDAFHHWLDGMGMRDRYAATANELLDPERLGTRCISTESSTRSFIDHLLSMVFTPLVKLILKEHLRRIDHELQDASKFWIALEPRAPQLENRQVGDIDLVLKSGLHIWSVTAVEVKADSVIHTISYPTVLRSKPEPNQRRVVHSSKQAEAFRLEDPGPVRFNVRAPNDGAAGVLLKGSFQAEAATRLYKRRVRYFFIWGGGRLFSVGEFVENPDVEAQTFGLLYSPVGNSIKVDEPSQSTDDDEPDPDPVSTENVDCDRMGCDVLSSDHEISEDASAECGISEDSIDIVDVYAYDVCKGSKKELAEFAASMLPNKSCYPMIQLVDTVLAAVLHVFTNIDPPDSATVGRVFTPARKPAVAVDVADAANAKDNDAKSSDVDIDEISDNVDDKDYDDYKGSEDSDVDVDDDGDAGGSEDVGSSNHPEGMASPGSLENNRCPAFASSDDEQQSFDPLALVDLPAPVQYRPHSGPPDDASSPDPLCIPGPRDDEDA